MSDEANVYNALCECLIRELQKEAPNPKIVECAVKFVKDQEISTMPGTNEGLEDLRGSLPFAVGKA